MSETVESVSSESSPGFLSSVINEIIYNPLNVALVVIIAVLIYKIIKGRVDVPHSHESEEPALPRLRRDFTLQELRKYDGTQPDGRVLVAVNGNVYDVTKGKRFYGPGGNYAAFGGRDASRSLAIFSVDDCKDEYDDLSDLNTMEMDTIREWEMQFKEKYILVGRLLKPGEEPTNYSDEEENATDKESKATEEEKKPDAGKGNQPTPEERNDPAKEERNDPVTKKGNDPVIEKGNNPTTEERSDPAKEERNDPATEKGNDPTTEERNDAEVKKRVTIAEGNSK